MLAALHCDAKGTGATTSGVERHQDHPRGPTTAEAAARATGDSRRPPKLRARLGGSAWSGKSTSLRTVAQRLRLLFQREGVDATVELTAYTGVAAFNIGFGARTACSSFHVFPNAAWKNELSGEALSWPADERFAISQTQSQSYDFRIRKKKCQGRGKSSGRLASGRPLAPVVSAAFH